MDSSALDKKNDTKISQLRALLYLLQTHLEEFKEGDDNSYALKVEEKNTLYKCLKQTTENPIRDIFQLSDEIESQTNYLLDKLVRSYFSENHSLIEKAFKTRKNPNDLHYSIVLREDNIKNRAIFFDFLNSIDLTNTSHKHPIHFQFIPSKLVEKIKFEEEIKLTKNE